ncbi:MAG TPA: amino acid ABC transporter permease [Acidimicrobiales bacterium]|nr:amino acid ABC transporter permease [Acidimicrobiales bacterium]
MTATAFADGLGPRGRRRVLVATVVSSLLLAALVAAGLRRLQANGQLRAENWRPFTDVRVLRFFLGGMINTMRAAGAAMVLALATGGLLALARLARTRWLRWPATAYVELFRGLPLYVLILFCGFGLPALDIHPGPFRALVLALTLYNGAVLAEIFRAGILSLDRGQSEAAFSLGLVYRQAMAYVVVPQAVRRMVPAIVSQLVTLLKDTSLGVAIFYEELLSRARINAVFTQRTLPSLAVVAVVYIVLNATLSRVASRLEARQRRRYGAGRIAVRGVEDLAVTTAKGAAAVEGDGLT